MAKKSRNEFMRSYEAEERIKGRCIG